MNCSKYLSPVLVWLPSVLVALVFVLNGWEKIVQPDQQGKVISDPVFIRGVGVLLLLATLLFLINRSLLVGSTFLAAYMTMIVGIHLYKGKPFEVALLIVIAVVFATYLRRPGVFHSSE